MKRLLVCLLLLSTTACGKRERSPASGTPLFSLDGNSSKASASSAYREIRDKHQNMTSAQWERFAASLKESPVINWRGRVYNVNKKRGKYEVGIVMESLKRGYGPTVTLIVDEGKALTLKRGDAITFSGIIKIVTTGAATGQLRIRIE